MGNYRLGVLEGDGIGPEIVRAAVEILEAAVAAEEVAIELMPLPVGLAAIQSQGTALPDTTVAALGRTDGWILGPHDSQSYPSAERDKLNPSGVLRKSFDLFANIRPIRSYQPGLRAVSPRMDLVIVRENTEGFYADRNMFSGSGEFMPTPDVALMVGVVTRMATERIARVAYEMARLRRKHVSIVHKANVLRLTHGLFRDVCREVAREYPDVTTDDWHVDAMTAHLVRHGQDFDVLVTENMIGDILSDLAGELAGSLGLAGSINAGADHAMAQATHGSAPDIAGRGIANPIGMIQSVALLLDWIGKKKGDPRLTSAARRIERAAERVLCEGATKTPDLGGKATTKELTAALMAAVREK